MKKYIYGFLMLGFSSILCMEGDGLTKQIKAAMEKAAYEKFAREMQENLDMEKAILSPVRRGRGLSSSTASSSSDLSSSSVSSLGSSTASSSSSSSEAGGDFIKVKTSPGSSRKRSNTLKDSDVIKKGMGLVQSYMNIYNQRSTNLNYRQFREILNVLLRPYWYGENYTGDISFNPDYRIGLSFKDDLDKTPQEVLDYVKNYVINLPLSGINNTLLMESSRDASSINYIRHLFMLGADPNLKDTFGYSALFYIAQGHRFYARDYKNISKIMPEDQIKKIKEENFGQDESEINRALENAYYENLIQLFLDYGADLNLKDNNGKTALDFAKKYEVTPLVNALEKLGAS